MELKFNDGTEKTFHLWISEENLTGTLTSIENTADAYELIKNIQNRFERFYLINYFTDSGKILFSNKRMGTPINIQQTNAFHCQERSNFPVLTLRNWTFLYLHQYKTTFKTGGYIVCR